MKLFSIQPIDVWEKLQKNQVLLADPLLGGHINLDWPTPGGHSLEEDMFYKAYDWMRQQMKKRISGYQGNWPWWAWYTWGTKNYKTYYAPDLRSDRFNYTSGEEFVRLHLEIPNEKVLLSCFDGWHSVLNGWFLCHTEEEDKFLESEWTSIGPKISLKRLRYMVDNNIDLPELSLEDAFKIQDFDCRIRQSWENVFDLNWMQSSPLWRGGTTIQACFEELRLDEVKKVTHFKGARKPRN